MSGVPYLCEAAGARIIRAGVGLSQIDADFQIDFTTWDLVPAGEVGDVSFRSIDVSGEMTNGLALGITPIVDGGAVPLPEQQFTLAGTGPFQVQAFFATRGTRIAARVRTLSRSGDVAIYNVQCANVVLRMTP